MSTRLKEGFFSFRGGDFDEAGMSATEIKSVLTEMGVVPEAARRAAVSAFEAEMNVIIHAVAGTMRYVIDDEKIVITVTDMGPGIKDVELAMQKGYTTAPDWARQKGWGSGLGLPNIFNNCDCMEIDTVVGEGTTLKVIVRFESKKNNPQGN